MNGEVTARREAVFPIKIRNSQSEEIAIDTVLDTGFDDFLTLPRILIDELRLPRIGSMPIVLADDRVAIASIHRAQVFWHDAWKTVSVQATESSTLLGMRLIYGSVVTLEVIDGGVATIEELE